MNRIKTILIIVAVIIIAGIASVFTINYIHYEEAEQELINTEMDAEIETEPVNLNIVEDDAAPINLNVPSSVPTETPKPEPTKEPEPTQEEINEEPEPDIPDVDDEKMEPEPVDVEGSIDLQPEVNPGYQRSNTITNAGNGTGDGGFNGAGGYEPVDPNNPYAEAPNPGVNYETVPWDKEGAIEEWREQGYNDEQIAYLIWEAESGYVSPIVH